MASGSSEESTRVFDAPLWKKELLLRKKTTSGPGGNAGFHLSRQHGVEDCRSARGMRYRNDVVGSIESTMRTVDESTAERPSSRLMDKLRAGYLKSVRNAEANGKDGNDGNSDSSEELQYGPGIVNKLKSKYLSMTLRDNQRYSSRPSLSQLRRATSLENMLDDESLRSQPKAHFVKKQPLPNLQKGCKISQHHAKYLGISKGDSMKRARSMDTLFKTEPRVLRPNGMTQSVIANEDLVIVDRETELPSKIVVPDNRELPPPDVVKQTKKLFEKPSDSVANEKRNKKTVLNKMNNNVKVGSVFDKPAERSKPLLSPKPILSDVKGPIRGNWGQKKVYPVVTTNKPLSSKGVPPKGAPARPASEAAHPVAKPVLLPLASSSPRPPPFVSVKPNLSGEGSALLLSPLRSSPIPSDPERSPDSPSKDHGSPIPKFYADNSLSSCFPRRNLMQATNSCLVKSQATEPTSIKQVAVIRPIPAKKPLTEQEVENNLINSVKNLKKVAEDNNVDASNDADHAQAWAKKSWQNTNTMVFNFSSRPTVPDYIENDGLNIAKRIAPKAPSGKDELDADEEWDSPALCEVSFVGDNIVINGKSNLRKEPSTSKIPARRIQFNDEATTLYEYPSEDSLIQEPSGSEVTSPCSSPVPQQPSPSPSPLLSSAALASYTPSKSATPAGFELGVTSTSSVLPHVQHSIQQPQQSDDYLMPVDINHEMAWSQETTADILF